MYMVVDFKFGHKDDFQKASVMNGLCSRKGVNLGI